MFSTYEEAVDFILNIPKFTTKNELKSTRAFLERLGDVSEIIPCVHIAGTNGKGSVSAFIKAGLNEAGYSVGMFTSPHLVDIRERFMIDNEMISRQEFLHVAKYVYSEVQALRETGGFSSYHPTFFEFLFFMSVVWFKSKHPDFIVMETGLGGRLDATNSISSPKVCVITEIGLDHMEYLGETKELIAFEKAGIIKRGVPVVYADRLESVSRVIEARALELSSDCYAISASNIKKFERSAEKIDFSITSRYDEIAYFTLNTKASYQVENAMLAYEAILFLGEKTGLNIDERAVRRGFSSMKWPGRMEEITPGLIVDGAHNEDGIEAFLQSVSNDGSTGRALLYSAVSDKQIERVASKICESGLFNSIYLCHLDSYRAADCDRMLAAFKDVKVTYCESVKDGIDALIADSAPIKYVAGSLYLVGEVKALLEI